MAQVTLHAQLSRTYRACCRLLVILAFAGCSATGEVSPRQQSIDPEKSVFAFSFSPGEMAEAESPVQPAWIYLQYGVEVFSVPLSRGQPDPQVFLFEVPANHVYFGQIELAVGDGIVRDHYLTNSDRYLDLKRGEITYIGRIEVEDVLFQGGGEGSPGTPVAVSLSFSDAYDEDIAELEQQYELLQRQKPDRQISDNWVGQDSFALSEKVWSNKRASVKWGNSGRSSLPPRRSDN